VLSDSGANRPLDDHDSRVIQETRDGTYTYTYTYTGTGPYGGYPGLPNSQDDVGGWEDYPTALRPDGFDTDGDGLPDWWETLIGTSTDSAPADFSDADSDPDDDGFTALDDYLHWLASIHVNCITDSHVDLDLAPHTRGYTVSPVFTFSDLAGCSAAMLPATTTARITPTVGFGGMASLTVTVTDSAVDNMSFPVFLRVAPSFPQATLGIGKRNGALELQATARQGVHVTVEKSATLGSWTPYETYSGDDATRIIPLPEPTPGESAYFRLQTTE
jgi:hypothetical protein